MAVKWNVNKLIFLNCDCSLLYCDTYIQQRKLPKYLKTCDLLHSICEVI